MEQHYDGLNGKIIKWTLENGNDNHDPSVLAFVVGPDGKVFASLMNGQQYQASSFSKWAKTQADAYQKAHPSTRLPFIRGTVAGVGEEASCPELEAARSADEPVLLYFGRGHFAEKDKVGKKESKAARKFEKGTLNSKTAAEQADGWVLLRFDLADDEHRLLARQFGVTTAPALVLLAPGAEQPETLDPRTTGGALAAILKKRKTAADE